MKDIRLCKTCNNELSPNQKQYCSKNCLYIGLSNKQKALWQTPEYRAKKSLDSKKMWINNIERKKQASKTMRDNLNKFKETEGYKEWRILLSKETANKLWQNQKYIDIMKNKDISKIKEMWKDEEYRDKMKKQSSLTLKKLWRDKSFRDKSINASSNLTKQRWQDETFRDKMINILKNANKDKGFDMYSRFILKGIKQCYLYLIIFNDNTNKFFKVGVSKGIKRPLEYIKKYKHINANLMLLRYGETKLVCDIEKYIHHKMKLPIFRQNIIDNGRTEIYDIKYYNSVLNYIKSNIP